ncbi:hypothetical protein E2C01_027345 [Portunus trituberculatus]|uniref:Uncharacterized protein n=1 Tax=Portunus trituberculatus TaxID=210409 RepID=A0A5B7EKK7_PORTR|nr:hypothetical protein [Portunus trituberculatus]
MAKVQLRLNPWPDKLTFSHGGKNRQCPWLPTIRLFGTIYASDCGTRGRRAVRRRPGAREVRNEGDDELSHVRRIPRYRTPRPDHARLGSSLRPFESIQCSDGDSFGMCVSLITFFTP